MLLVMLFGRRRSSGLVRCEPVCRLRRSVAYGRLGPRVIVTPVLRRRGCTGLAGSMAVVRILGSACCSRLRSFRLAPHMNAQARAQTRRGQSSLGHGNPLLDLGQLLRAHTFDGFDSLAIRRDRRRCNNRIGAELVAHGIHHHGRRLLTAVIHGQGESVLAQRLVERHRQARQTLTAKRRRLHPTSRRWTDYPMPQARPPVEPGRPATRRERPTRHRQQQLLQQVAQTESPQVGR